MKPVLMPRVIVVEDHPFQRSVLSSVLRDIGVSTVIEASNGVEALRAFVGSADPIDLIICDLQMPCMDGVEFLRRIGECGATPAIVVSSAMERTIVASVTNMAEAYGLRVLGALGKPPERTAVQQFLERAMDARPAGQAAEIRISDQDLEAGIQDQQFSVHYQPKVGCADGRLQGCEALIRWQHPTKGMIPPNTFIPLAEETGHIDRLTDIVVDAAARHLRQCERFGPAFHMSVNLSVNSLVDVNFPDRVSARLARHGVKPSDFVLEVTERQVIGHLAQALDCLSRLRLKGFGLAVDDFGTGFASLHQLRCLPVTEVKVDQEFVHRAGEDSDRRSILESSVSLGRKLGLSIVAEGVEDQADWRTVAALSCDMVQGYFIAKPMPADQFLAWSREKTELRDAALSGNG